MFYASLVSLVNEILEQTVKNSNYALKPYKIRTWYLETGYLSSIDLEFFYFCSIDKTGYYLSFHFVLQLLSQSDMQWFSTSYFTKGV